MINLGVKVHTFSIFEFNIIFFPETIALLTTQFFVFSSSTNSSFKEFSPFAISNLF
ncbi:hypothetical protein [Malaciobacter mytili]|uniref:hypothetical protein n=1 Tax=Malaciobacter mytili TaxID=603050 RepID=UPI003A88A77B